MSHSYSRLGAFAVFCCWAAVGAAAGMAIAYFVYARQPRTFAVTAVVRFDRSRSEAGDKSEAGDNAVRPNVSALAENNRTPDTSLLPRYDDSLLLCSQAVLARAAESGGLLEIPELQLPASLVQANDGEHDAENAAEQLVRNWVSSGQLTVEQAEATSRGGLYRVSFVAKLPSVSSRVVSAVVAAMVDEFDGPAGQAQVEESVKQLRLQSQSLADQAESLMHEIAKLELPANATLAEDGEVVSAAAVRLEAAIGSFERLTREREDLQKRLRRAEELQKQNADDRAVLETLGLLVVGDRTSVNGTVPDEKLQVERDRQRKRQEWLDRKQKLAAMVEREVEPLQKQLDELLGVKFGPQHPQIKHLKTLIAKSKGRLAEYAVEPDFGLDEFEFNGKRVTDPSDTADPDGLQNQDPAGQENGIADTDPPSLRIVLNVLRGESARLAEQIRSVDESLEVLATTVATENQSLKTFEKLDREIQQLHVERNSLELEIQKLLEPGENVASSCEVLVAAGPAKQVSPVLRSYLQVGSFAGVLAGLVLFVILWFAISIVPGKALPGETQE